MKYSRKKIKACFSSLTSLLRPTRRFIESPKAIREGLIGVISRICLALGCQPGELLIDTELKRKKGASQDCDIPGKHGIMRLRRWGRASEVCSAKTAERVTQKRGESSPPFLFFNKNAQIELAIELRLNS
jgi:hypothetical protein